MLYNINTYFPSAHCRFDMKPCKKSNCLVALETSEHLVYRDISEVPNISRIGIVLLEESACWNKKPKNICQ